MRGSRWWRSRHVVAAVLLLELVGVLGAVVLGRVGNEGLRPLLGQAVPADYCLRNLVSGGAGTQRLADGVACEACRLGDVNSRPTDFIWAR
jgi:hypothetical protein